MPDIDDDGLIDSRRDEAIRIARLQAEGEPCPRCENRHGHWQFCSLLSASSNMLAPLPISGPTEEVLNARAAKLTKSDICKLADDAVTVDLTMTTEVSAAVRAECEAEMEAAEKRGWKLLADQKSQNF